MNKFIILNPNAKITIDKIVYNLDQLAWLA